MELAPDLITISRVSRTMCAASKTTTPVRFGIYEFDTRRCELRKQGLRIRLRHQASQLLSFLLKAPGRIRTREELRHQLWPATTFVNFDHSINKAVHELREALGDWATNPRFIETVVGQGYRFIPVVQRSRSESEPTGDRKIRSVAVLPFTSAATEAGAAFVSGQITSRVIDGLSKISTLRVLAYSTVRDVTSQNATPQQIGKQLGVGHVVFGELFWQGDDLLVHVELIDVADGSQIWGAQLRRKCESLIECAEQLAEGILEQLQPNLELPIPRAAPRARSSPRPLA